MVTTHDEAASTMPQIIAAMNAPHDHLAFEALRDCYNFQQTSCWQRTFLRLLAAEADRIRDHGSGVRVLDIGCGLGIGRRPQWTRAVRPHFDELWGIEPDPSIEADPSMFDHFQTGTIQAADLPEGQFDLAYSFMVVEHVAKPDEYMSAIARALRPGGVHFFVTVNGRHYFARLAKALERARLADAVLRLVRGRSEVDAYHYPVQYRMNRTRQLDQIAEDHGFQRPEYVFIEEEGPAPYFRGPLKPLMASMMFKRRVLKNPRNLLTLYCRMQKQG